MDRKYKDLIFTNHALSRTQERGLSQGDIWVTWRNSDQSREAQKKGNWIYYKTYGDKKIEVVTAKNEKGQTVVLSVWSRPVYGAKKIRPSSNDGLLEKILQFLLGWAKQ